MPRQLSPHVGDLVDPLPGRRDLDQEVTMLIERNGNPGRRTLKARKVPSANAKFAKVRTSALRLDFQSRENLDEESVHRYAQTLRNGESLPAIYVRFDGTSYFLQDGFHRVEAARREELWRFRLRSRPVRLRTWKTSLRNISKNSKSGSALLRQRAFNLSLLLIMDRRNRSRRLK